MKKSLFTSFVLTLLFGPFGVFYSSTAGGLGLVACSLVFIPLTFGLGSIILWPVSILVGIHTTQLRNQELQLQEQRHQEIMQKGRRKRNVENRNSGKNNNNQRQRANNQED